MRRMRREIERRKRITRLKFRLTIPKQTRKQTGERYTVRKNIFYNNNFFFLVKICKNLVLDLCIFIY